MKAHITTRALDIHADLKKNEQFALPDLK